MGRSRPCRRGAPVPVLQGAGDGGGLREVNTSEIPSSWLPVFPGCQAWLFSRFAASHSFRGYSPISSAQYRPVTRPGISACVFPTAVTASQARERQWPVVHGWSQYQARCRSRAGTSRPSCTAAASTTSFPGCSRGCLLRQDRSLPTGYVPCTRQPVPAIQAEICFRRSPSILHQRESVGKRSCICSFIQFT